MNEQIESTLRKAEEAVASGRSLKGTGFWNLVDVARRERAVAEAHGERIAAIDRKAFENAVRLRVPAFLGVLILLAVTVFGLAAIWAAPAFELGDQLRLALDCPPRCSRSLATPITFLVGTAALIVGTHSLTHWLVGGIARIRFTHVFLGGPFPPRPGVKTDYETYLKASRGARAAMHASGAVVTKIVPFALIPWSLDLYDQWPWVTWILLAIGVVQILTDVFLSTKTSDWKKVRRELATK